MLAYEQVAVLEEVADLALDPLLAAGGTPRRLRAGAAPRQLRGAGRQALALLGHGREDRLGDLAEDVERAELMGHVAEDRGDRLGVERRAVGRDPLEGQPARRQGRVEVAKERLDVLVVRGAAQDLVGSRLKVRLSTIERMQNGPSYSSSAAMKPEKSERAQSR